MHRIESISHLLHWRIISTTLSVLITSGIVFAQNASFTASVDREEVALDGQFQITFTLSGGSLSQYKDFRQPNLNAQFLTLMGPSTSQQMQIMNGKVSSSISWTYVLQPRNLGTFTIGSASISYEGTMMKSNAVKIKVVTGLPQSKQKQQTTEAEPNVELGSDLFIRASANKRDVYLGEPVAVTFKLYSRVAFQLENPIKLPRMMGFWSEDIETPTQLRPTVEVYNGKQYETYILRKVIYFPTQTGALSIDPFEINCTVRVRQKRKTRDDYFDRFFSDPFFDSYTNVKKTLMTEKILVHAKAFPEKDKPASFNGAVGSYTMNTSLDRHKLKANETAALKITIRGEGNINLLEGPAIAFPSGIDHFDPKVDNEIIRGDNKISGVKRFEYLLIPRFEGKQVLSPIEFSYFDPEKKKYIKLSSESFELDVAAGDKSISPTSTANYLTKDIKPLRSISTISSKSGREQLSFVLFMYAFPLLVMIGGILWKERYDATHADLAGMRMRRATKTAEKHLIYAKRFLQTNNIDSYYLEVAHALWGYIQHKLKLPTAETSQEGILHVLLTRQVSQETISKVGKALDAVEYARYSPTRTSESEMRDLYDLARDAIVSMEEGLKAI